MFFSFVKFVLLWGRVKGSNVKLSLYSHAQVKLANWTRDKVTWIECKFCELVKPGFTNSQHLAKECKAHNFKT